MERKSILVTGANGFLGRAIVSALAAGFVRVRATDLGPSGDDPAVDYRQADVTRPEVWAEMMAGTDAVIHAAGLAHVFSPAAGAGGRFFRVNEDGTANVAAAAAEAGVGHFILLSSVAVYGPSAGASRDEHAPCAPSGPYALSKYRAELRAAEIASGSGMALSILRLATVYGDGDPGNVGRLLRAIDRGRFLWIGSGSNRKSLLHVEDAARACRAVALRPGAGVAVYNVSAPPATMREVVEGLARELGRSVPPFGVPASWVRGASGMLSAMPLRRLRALGATARKWLADDVYDGRSFERAFDFQAQVTLADGLRREVAWFRGTKK